MDPLSLAMTCALVLQPGPDGLRCKTSQPQNLLLADGAGKAKSDLRKTVSGTSKWQSEIAMAAQRFNVPEAWITAVMKAESGGHTTLNGHPVTSSSGATGLMQLMPGTYEDMRQRYGLGSDTYDPQNNILAGAAYLRAMYERYGYPHLFGAYNAGPGRFDAYLLGGKPLPSETRDYIEKIVPGTGLTSSYATANLSRAAPTTPVKAHGLTSLRALFFMRSAANDDEKGAPVTVANTLKNARSKGALFVPLTSNLHTPEK